MLKNLNNLKYLLYFLFLSILTLSSSLIIYEKKDSLIDKLTPINNPKNIKSNLENQEDKDWVKELQKGGYIIFMRHAERDKWLDVGAYDGLEVKILNRSNEYKRSAANEYYGGAVCLNTRGKIQSKMINEIFDYSKIQFKYISSSPLCRSKQTALAIGEKIDDVTKVLLHSGIDIRNISEWRKKIREYLLDVPIKDNSNTLITAHGKMIIKEMFDNQIKNKTDGGPNFKINEGGFYIISRDGKNLIFNKQFTNFQDFAKQVFLVE